MPTAEAVPSTLPAQSGDPDALVQEKARFRTLAIARRSEAAALAGADAAERLASRFLAAVALSAVDRVVSGYFPIGEEMDPRPLMARLAASGRALCLPVTPRRGLPLSFRSWQPGDPLRPRPFGLLEPEPSAPGAEPDLLLVPLLAFDASGGRLGYGGGFYDRTLAGLRARRPVRAIGIAFEGQRCEHVPVGPTDARLDAIVTEAGFHPARPVGE